MRKTKFTYIVICCSLAFALTIPYVFSTPYKIKRTLPKISPSQVERVIAWEGGDTKNNLLKAGTFDIERLIT